MARGSAFLAQHVHRGDWAAQAVYHCISAVGLGWCQLVCNTRSPVRQPTSRASTV
jgi:hypothetical protein